MPRKGSFNPADDVHSGSQNKSTSGEDAAKAEGGETAAASNFSRGEGQKPATTAYKENWNAIYAKKKKR
jgi:hypothetical protein